MALGIGTAAIGRPQYINIREKNTSNKESEIVQLIFDSDPNNGLLRIDLKIKKLLEA